MTTIAKVKIENKAFDITINDKVRSFLKENNLTERFAASIPTRLYRRVHNGHFNIADQNNRLIFSLKKEDEEIVILDIRHYRTSMKHVV